MIKLFILSLLISCASSLEKKLPANTTVITKEHASAKEARNFVRNKWNYLFLLFEQSHDPYYGTPRWQEECLKKNTIGKIHENKGNLAFLSRFLLDEKKEPGHCEGVDTEVIFLYCANQSVSYEIHCLPGTCEKVFKSDIICSELLH